MGEFLLKMTAAVYLFCVACLLVAVTDAMWVERRFSLRSLMLTMTLVAMLLGVAVYAVK